jgi:hypothetical protein
MLFHLVIDVLHAAHMAHAIEDALRLRRQHRAAERHAAVACFDLECSRMRTGAAELGANARHNLIIVRRGRRTAKVRPHFSLQALHSIAQIPDGNVGRVSGLITKPHTGVAE